MRTEIWSPLRQTWREIALSVLLGSFTVGANIALFATAGYLIAKAATHPTTILLLWVPIVAVRFFGIARSVFRYIDRLTSHDLAFRMVTHLRSDLYGLLEPRWPAAMSSVSNGELIHTMVDDVETYQNMFLRVLSPPAVALMSVALPLLITYLMGGVVMTLILFAGLVSAGVVFPLLKARHRLHLRRTIAHVQAMLSQQMGDIVAGRTDLLMSSDGGQGMLRSNAELQARLSRLRLRLSRQEEWVGALVGTTAMATAWFMVRVALPSVQSGSMSGVMLCVVILTTLASFEAILPLSSVIASYQESQASLQRLEEIPTWPIAAPEPEFKGTRHSTFDRSSFEATGHGGPNPLAWHIQMTDVSFAYTADAHFALHDISLDIWPGKHVAIVGPNGSGKSTLVYLLTRLWDVTEGKITMDGVDVRDLRAETIRKSIAVVDAHPYLFHASLADNLRIANPAATPQQLRDSLRAVHLSDWVNQLPNGMETLMGDTGVMPSTGQRRRISIARALLTNARVFLLDEPLDSLDPLLHSQIQALLDDCTRGKTVIQISHQLHNIENADEIVVLQHGRIVERGTHAQLVCQPGIYQEMWDSEHDLLAWN